MTSDVIPQIVEIVGPAGAGKTTLSRELSSNASIQLRNFPDVRKIANAPFFAWNGLQVFAALLGLPRQNSRKITRREFAWLSILRGWPKVLQKELKENHGIFILDQGPVYLLTETSEFGPQYLKKQKARLFWEYLFSRWADVLDMIVWLDAADTELLARIRNRDKVHAIKNESVETAVEFLTCYRMAYERTISGLLVSHPGLKVLRFDTGKTLPNEIADQLLFRKTSAR